MKLTIPILLVLIALASTGCEAVKVRPPYVPVGYKPTNPSTVRVKDSLQNRMVYVL